LEQASDYVTAKGTVPVEQDHAVCLLQLRPEYFSCISLTKHRVSLGLIFRTSSVSSRAKCLSFMSSNSVQQVLNRGERPLRCIFHAHCASRCGVVETEAAVEAVEQLQKVESQPRHRGCAEFN
jgi:hypothetical protein